jgi:hypothetical protein
MLIEIEISSALHDLIPISEKNLTRDQWEVPEGTLVGDVLNLLSLNQVPTMVILNQGLATEEPVLKEGDILRIFPLATGG